VAWLLDSFEIAKKNWIFHETNLAIYRISLHLMRLGYTGEFIDSIIPVG